MKYIKTYEDINKIPIYKSGDYVIVDFDNQDVKDFIRDNVHNCDNIAKIINVALEGIYTNKIIFYNGYIFNVKNSEILRLATQDEIDEYEAKTSAKKYNL